MIDRDIHRVVLVATASEAPASRADTAVLVLDTSWTPGPDDRPDLLPLRRILGPVFGRVDLFNDALQRLDGWADVAGLPTRLSVRDVSIWYAMREELWHWLHERLIWRAVAATLSDRFGPVRFVVDSEDPALLDVMRGLDAQRPGEVVEFRATAGAAIDQPKPRTSGATPWSAHVQRWLGAPDRRLRRRRLARRVSLLDDRIRTMAAEPPDRVLVISYTGIHQRIEGASAARSLDPNLGSVIERMRREGPAPIVIGLGLDHRNDDTWPHIAADPRLLPQSMLATRWHGNDVPDPALIEAATAALRGPDVPLMLDGVDLGPALMTRVRAFAEAWLTPTLTLTTRVEHLIAELRPGALVLTHEGIRAAWLAAAQRAGIPSFAVQHGMLYPTHPGYCHPRDATLVIPDRTFVYGPYERDVLLEHGGYRSGEVEVSGSPRVDLDAHGRAGPAIEAERSAVRRELGVDAGDRLLVVSTAHAPLLRRYHLMDMLEKTLGGPLPGVHLVFKQHPAEPDEGPVSRPAHRIGQSRRIRAATDHGRPRRRPVSPAACVRRASRVPLDRAHRCGRRRDAEPDRHGPGVQRPARLRRLGGRPARARCRRRPCRDARTVATGPRLAAGVPRAAFPARRCRGPDRRTRPRGPGRRRPAIRRGGSRATACRPVLMRVVAIVQARMGSSRLPGKVMLPLLGEPILTRVVRRTGRARTLDDVVVATTTRSEDDAIVALVEAEGRPVVRGSETDLLDRYLQAARAHDADVIVRVTSDCPLIDPGGHRSDGPRVPAGDVEYASNTLEPRTYPRGLDVEVIARAALERADREDRDPAWREHATPYIYRHPESFRLLRVAAEDDHADQRWSVDTPEDFALVEKIYEAIGRDDFGWREALAVVEAHPVVGLDQPPRRPEGRAARRGAFVSERHAVIRADASVSIGTGHLVRSRTLAEGLMARGWRTTIVTRDLIDGLAAGLVGVGIEIVRLPGGSSIESEPEAIAERIGPGATLIVSDHYGLGGQWFHAMRRRVPGAVLMAIDDLADRPLPVDLVLNQNLGAGAHSYAALASASTRILAGAAYALLRPEFAELRAHGRERDGRVDRILVFFSGSDDPDVTARAVAGLVGLGLPIDVVVGATYPHLARLQAAVARDPAVTIFVNTDEMASLMARADLALGAASSASWERCSLGLPALLVTMADNQVDAQRHLVEAGRGAGDRVAHVGHVGRHRTGGPGPVCGIRSS